MVTSRHGFSPCPDCGQHIRSVAPCPFCDGNGSNAISRLRKLKTGILAGALLGAAGLMVACDDGEDEPAPTPDIIAQPAYGAVAADIVAGTDAAADAETDVGPDIVAQPAYGIPQP